MVDIFASQVRIRKHSSEMRMYVRIGHLGGKRVGVGKLANVKPMIGSEVFGENSHKLEILLSTLDSTNHLS